MKRKRKRLAFERRRANKILRRISRRKRGHYSLSEKQRERKFTRPKVSVYAPEIFCIEENPDDVNDFFQKSFEAIYKCRKNGIIWFELSAITKAAPDAVMYLIALLNNTKHANVFNICFKGNMPNDSEARKVFEFVGFYNYVSSCKRQIRIQNNDKLKILKGNDVDVVQLETICRFAGGSDDEKTRLSTKGLFRILVELMTNTHHHAYTGEQGKMKCNWYLYAEKNFEIVRFVFLDTGLGIPTTIRKNWSEKIMDFFQKNKDDARYIEAALMGEFRTETLEVHRGKGMPEIYGTVKNPDTNLFNLSIVSGKGICFVNNEGIIEKKVLSKALEGTMYRWEFRKSDKLDSRKKRSIR